MRITTLLGGALRCLLVVVALLVGMEEFTLSLAVTSCSKANAIESPKDNPSHDLCVSAENELGNCGNGVG